MIYVIRSEHNGRRGAPLRALQEWMGHRDYKTTSIYADYAADPSQVSVWAERAFGETRTRKVLGPGELPR